MLSGFFGHWSGLKPSHKAMTLIIILIIAIGTNLIAIACSDLIMQFASTYTILILGVLLSILGAVMSLMRPHPITVGIIGLGIIFILIGAYIGG